MDGATRLTYSEWDAASDRAAGAFVRMGLQPGDVVALFLPMGIDYPIAYLGALKTGVVTAGINPRFKEREVRHILESSGARILVTSDALREIAEPVRPESLERVVAPEELRQSDAIEHLYSHAPEDPAAIVYTSGTTGLPKGATYTAGALEAIRRIEAEAGIHEGPRVLAAVPLPHMAFMTKIASTIERRSFTVLVERWTARFALEAIELERLTDTGGIPTQLMLMLMDAEFAKFDLSSLRLVTIGGAPAAPELIRQIRESFGVPVMARYSCTEVGLACGTRARDPDEVVAHTVGRPLPQVELRVLDAAGKPAPDGEIGEIAIRSPAMMAGYWRDPDATRAAVDPDGFFHTGDLGCVGDDGNIRLSGRSKDMYIRGGYNVYPAEVEAVLGEHPKVALAAVVGVPDTVLGERGKAYVVPRDAGDPPSENELKTFVSERIADYKAPDEFEIRPELPMTAMFKVDKQALRP